MSVNIVKWWHARKCGNGDREGTGNQKQMCKFSHFHFFNSNCYLCTKNCPMAKNYRIYSGYMKIFFLFLFIIVPFCFWLYISFLVFLALPSMCFHITPVFIPLLSRIEKDDLDISHKPMKWTKQRSVLWIRSGWRREAAGGRAGNFSSPQGILNSPDSQC